jgi:toxin ParE1/3/4
MSGPRLPVKLSVLADFDLEEIVAYTVQQWGEITADQYLAELYDALDDIEHFQAIGTMRNDLMRGMRRYVVKDHSLLYRIEEDEIRVYRIVHVRIDMRNLRLE